MPRLLTGIDWLNDLFLHPPMPRKNRHLTVTVDGENREAKWKQSVGIYVNGEDVGRRDTVEVEGALHKVTDIRRMQMHGEAVTLILGAMRVGG